MNRARLILVLITLALSPVTHADVEVLGLFKNAALLKLDKEQKLLKVGQTWKGIELLEADSREGSALIDGQLQILTLSRHIGSSYTEASQITVSIRKNEHLQYITTALINGRSTPVLVDTGANVMAMNANTARAIGLDYTKGTLTQVTTASGSVNAYQVVLASVDVGGLVATHVRASVLEGDYPEMVLLGTSYLQHVEMREKEGILMLMRNY